MEHYIEDPTNGTAGVHDPRHAWPTRTEAARRLRVSVSTIRRMQDRGDLMAVDIGGSWRFDPNELDAADVTAGNEPSSDVLAIATGLVRQAHAHNERLLDLLVRPIAQLTEAMGTQTATMGAQTAKMADRIDVLEKKNTEMLEGSEAALSLQHERHLKELEFHAAQNRKNEAFTQLVKFAPVVVEHIAAYCKGVDVDVAKVAAMVDLAPRAERAEVAAAVAGEEPAVPIEGEADMVTLLEVVASLSDAQLALLGGTGAVTPAELEAIGRVRGALRADEAPPPGAAHAVAEPAPAPPTLTASSTGKRPRKRGGPPA